MTVDSHEALVTFIGVVRQWVRERAPELEYLLDDYEGEALFGLAVIHHDLERLPAGAPILEIGAGTLILSSFLQHQGFKVTAVEPIGVGFSHFDRLRDIVLACADSMNAKPVLCHNEAESISFANAFDYAFSINVMEHVNDVAQVIRSVMRALKPGGSYHFLCPNYTFPYEPHFNIPTLFSKSLTARLLHKQIFESSRVVDAAGTWASLNWISVSQVKKICAADPGIELAFDHNILFDFIRRALSDPHFQQRRGQGIQRLLSALDRIGIIQLCKYIPVTLQPAMSCMIRKC